MPRRHHSRNPPKESSKIVLARGLLADSRSLEDTAKLFVAVGHPVRLRALFVLDIQPYLPVSALRQALQVQPSVLSRHLAILRQHRLISRHNWGRPRCYRLTDHPFLRLLRNAFWRRDPPQT